MGQFRIQISPAWLVAAMAIFAVNVAGVLASLQPKSIWIPVAPGGGASLLLSQMYDGSVVKYVHPYGGRRIGPIVIQPASPMGLWRVWWPLAASIGGSLLILAVAWKSTRWRRGQAIRPRRMTMLHVMILIGLTAFGLWLIRFDSSLIIAGSAVLGMLLLTVYRRSVLVDETKAEGRSAPALSQIGIAGYSIAVLLALAWVITILVWDSYRRGRS